MGSGGDDSGMHAPHGDAIARAAGAGPSLLQRMDAAAPASVSGVTYTEDDSRDLTAGGGGGGDNASAETAVDDERVLTEEEIRGGLGDLGPTASGLRQAYLCLSVPFLSLTSLEGVDRFVHLQTLVASGNNLRDISGSLGALRSLTHLDVSDNKLECTLEGVSPAPIALRSIDFSDNRISSCECLSAFHHLEVINLSGNRIENVEAETFTRLPILKKLCLGRNRLRSLHGLKGMQALRHLDISSNSFRDVSELRQLHMLTHLDISDNGLLTLGATTGSSHTQSAGVLHGGVSGGVHGSNSAGGTNGGKSNSATTKGHITEELPLLGTLLMARNNVSSLNGLLPLQRLPYLHTLAVEGNTLTQAHKSRSHVLYLLPSLTHLDGTEVRIEEKVEAANLHGADLEGLRSIRSKFFPEHDDDALLQAPDEHTLRSLSLHQAQPSSSCANVPSSSSYSNHHHQHQTHHQASPMATSILSSSTTMSETTMGVTGRGAIGGGSTLNQDNGSRTTGDIGSVSQTANETADANEASMCFDIPLEDLIDVSEFGAYVLKNTGNKYDAARACFIWMKRNMREPGIRYQVLADDAVPDAIPMLQRSQCSQAVERMLCGGIGGMEDDYDGANAGGNTDTVSHTAHDAMHPTTCAAEDKARSKMPWSYRASLLFQRLVGSCGIECSIVRGIARFPGMPVGRVLTRSNHHWNVVMLDAHPYIVDVSWAIAGLEPNAFCIPPDESIYQRLPEDSRDQQLEAPVTPLQFWSLPYCMPAFFELGLQLMNHASSIIPIDGGNNEVCLRIAAPPNVIVYHVSRLHSSVAAAGRTGHRAQSNATSSSTETGEQAATRLATADVCDDFVRLMALHQSRHPLPQLPDTFDNSSSNANNLHAVSSHANVTLAQRDVDGNFVLRTVLRSFEPMYINVFAYECAPSCSSNAMTENVGGEDRPRLVLCYRVYREPMRVVDEEGGSLHTLPFNIHSNDLDSATSLSYPFLSRAFVKQGCTIIEPIVGRLVEGCIENFHVRVPGAVTVSVAAKDGFRNTLSRQYLRRKAGEEDKDVFVGQICVPGSSCIVLATFDGMNDTPVLMLTYEVLRTRERSAVAAVAMPETRSNSLVESDNMSSI